MSYVAFVLVGALFLLGCQQPVPESGEKDCGSDWSCFQAAGAADCTPARVDFSYAQGQATLSGFAFVRASPPSGTCSVHVAATGASAPSDASDSEKAAVAFIQNSPIKPSMDCTVSSRQFAAFSFDRFSSSAALDAYGCRGLLADALRRAS